MIEDNNNAYDLETIQVATPGPFNVGDTLHGRASFGALAVHFRDETTLLIKPVDRRGDWVPCHIYARGGFEGV